MLKMIARLEATVGEKVFHLDCDPQSPLHEVREALSQFMTHVDNIEKLALEAAKKAEEEKQSSSDCLETVEPVQE